MKVVKRLSSLLLAMPLMAGTFLPVHAQQNFDEYLENEFSELISQSYLDSHFSMEDADKYVKDKPEVKYGEVSWDEYVEDKSDFEKRLKKLHEYDRDSLTEQQKSEYDSYEFYLNNMISLNDNPEFDFAFAPASSAIESIQTNLSEFVFRDEQDFSDYLKVVGSVDQYLDDCLEVTKKQAEDGYYLTDAQLEEICSIIDSFVEKRDDNALIVSFDDALNDCNYLDEETKEVYSSQNKDMIINKVIPSFNKVEDELKSLKGSRNGGYAVYDLKGGKEYYASLAKMKTGMDEDVDDMLDTCTSYLKICLNQYMDLMTQSDTSFMDETVDLNTPEEILAYLEKNIKDLPELGNVNYTVSYLDPSIASPSISAYYVTPPIDDLSNNVMKINGDNVSDVNDLYSTLAHEGFPGHLYQTVEYYSGSVSPLRYITGPIGYTEGWAMYAETLGWSVAPVSKEAAAMQCVQLSLNYVLDAAVDLGVNGLGWSVKDAEEYLDNLGLNSSIAQDLYDFVTLQPGVILPYGYGIAEILMLKQKVKNAMGTGFSNQEFNEVILNGGARPFMKVEEDVDTYLEGKGVSAEVKEDTSEKKESHSSIYLYVTSGIVVVGAMVLFIKRKKK